MHCLISTHSTRITLILQTITNIDAVSLPRRRSLCKARHPDKASNNKEFLLHLLSALSARIGTGVTLGCLWQCLIEACDSNMNQNNQCASSLYSSEV